MRLIKFGIATAAEQQARTLAIVGGRMNKPPDDPKMWFLSVNSALRVLADEASVFHQEIRAKYAEPTHELAAVDAGQASDGSGPSRAAPQFRLVRMERDGEVVSDAALADRIVVAFK